MWLEEHGLPEEVVRAPVQINTYDAQISLVDAQLKQLVDFVDEHEAGAKILWVITADHGEGLGNHGHIGHGKHLYQEQIRVPLILYGGHRWRHGLTVPHLVRHVDLLPTLAELTGVEIDLEALAIEGRSLVPLLRRDAQRWPPPGSPTPSGGPPTASGWPPGLVMAVRSERYKYILQTDAEDEFYDLESDPLERRNLVAEDSEEKERLVAWLVRKYESMQTGLPGSADEVRIDEEFVDELKALGYLE